MKSLNVSGLQFQRASKLTFYPGSTETLQDRIRRAGGAKIKLPIPIKVGASKGRRNCQQQGTGRDKQKMRWRVISRYSRHIRVHNRTTLAAWDGFQGLRRRAGHDLLTPGFWLLSSGFRCAGRPRLHRFNLGGARCLLFFSTGELLDQIEHRWNHKDRDK